MSFSGRFKQAMGVGPGQFVATTLSIAWKIAVAIFLIRLTLEMQKGGL